MIKIGRNPEITNLKYHSDREFVSSSGLKMAYKNMREYHKLYVLGDTSSQPSGAQLDFGSLCHSMILEPEKTHAEFAFYDGVKRGKDWEAFKELHLNKIILSKGQYEKAKWLVELMNKAVILIDYPEKGTVEKPVMGFFKKGEAEVTFADRIMDVGVKVRADYMREFVSYNSINDLKTTSESDLSLENIERICQRWSYDISAALYSDVIANITKKPSRFYFIFASTTTGECKVVKASNQMISRGREKYLIGINNIRQARESGIYFKNEIEEVNALD